MAMCIKKDGPRFLYVLLGTFLQAVRLAKVLGSFHFIAFVIPLHFYIQNI